MQQLCPASLAANRRLGEGFAAGRVGTARTDGEEETVEERRRACVIDGGVTE